MDNQEDLDKKEESQLQPASPTSEATKSNPSILGLEEYRVSNPKEIGTILKQLMLRKDFVVITPTTHQTIVSSILEVDIRESLFLYDLNANPELNEVLLKSSKNYFSATQNGASIAFMCGTPEQGEFDGSPVFHSPFPQVLYRRQRREFFRVDAPVVDPYLCTVEMPDQGEVVFEIADLSVTGVGLRSKEEWLTVANIPSGTIMTGAMLDFREQGKLILDLEIASMRNKRPGGKPLYHIGCRLPNLPGAKEAQLQRVINFLEFAQKKAYK
jgi:flagellar brake protein